MKTQAEVDTLYQYFPMLLRVLGYASFHDVLDRQLALVEGDALSVNQIGARIPYWFKDKIAHERPELALDSARIDWAAVRAGIVHDIPALDTQLRHLDVATLAQRRFKLQPHLHLFSLSGDLFSLRDQLLGFPVEHWQERALPRVQRRG
jgi:hypothetical protein